VLLANGRRQAVAKALQEDILIFCRRFGRVKGEMQSVYNPQMQAGKPYTHRSRSRPAAHYSSLKDIGDYDNPGDDLFAN